MTGITKSFVSSNGYMSQQAVTRLTKLPAHIAEPITKPMPEYKPRNATFNSLHANPADCLPELPSIDRRLRIRHDSDVAKINLFDQRKRAHNRINAWRSKNR